MPIEIVDFDRYSSITRAGLVRNQMRRNPYLTDIRRNATKGTTEATLRLPRTWNRQAMYCATWLVNQGWLPERLYLWIGVRLGYKLSSL